MNAIGQWMGEEALKAGGGLAFLGAGIGGFVAWPKDCTVSIDLYGAPKSNCHNALGPLPVGETHLDLVAGFVFSGAILGAAIAFGLVALGLFKKSDLGMPED